MIVSWIHDIDLNLLDGQKTQIKDCLSVQLSDAY
jgi:hypothetical protein